MIKINAIFALIVMLSSSNFAGAQPQTNVDTTNKAKGSTGNASTANRLGNPIATPNRSIYMNGVDISSARNQDLRNVHIKISENGDLYISAPQYQVTEEETFLPLSTRVKQAIPEHKPAQAMNSLSDSKTVKSAGDRTASNLPNTPATPAAPAANTLKQENQKPDERAPSTSSDSQGNAAPQP